VISHDKFGTLISDRAVPDGHQAIWFPAVSLDRVRRHAVTPAFSAGWRHHAAGDFVSCFFICEPELGHKLMYTLGL